MPIKELFEFELFHINEFSFKVGNIILSIGAILLNLLIIRIVSKFILKSVKSKPDEYGHRFAIVQLIKYTLSTIAIIIALQTLGLNLTFLLASSAALLVGLGLGMQIIFKDFLSGIILLIEGSIKINDIVQINEQVLKVRKISLRTSEVMTRDDNVLIIPNHKFTEENVINWTYIATPTRFSIDIGVDYSSDLTKVQQFLLQSVTGIEDVIQSAENEPFVRFVNFGASSLEFQLSFWSYNLFRIEATKSAIRFEIARIFKENNIIIPFPQLVVHQA